MSFKAIADDWMVIIDASIQMGEQKCLLVFGCRQSNLPRGRAPALQDFEILGLRIVSKLNANIITQMLLKIASRVGKIASICSDRGSDMVRGVKDFKLINPLIRLICDTAHRVANLLEAVLEKSERWKKFRDQVTLSRRKMQNSLVAGALPPSPRTKARYMNVGSLIEWAADMLILLDCGDSTPELDIVELRKYLEWLPNYRDDICYWNKLVSLGVAARQLVRTEGIHEDLVDHFEQSISAIPIGAKELEFANEISLFLLEQSQGLKPGDRFIGSTEALESFFGKFKSMEHEQTAFGFTSLVLAAAACVGPTDEKTIEEAIKSIKLSDIDNWTKEEIGATIQSKRGAIKQIVKRLKKKVSQKVSGILEKVTVGF